LSRVTRFTAQQPNFAPRNGADSLKSATISTYLLDRRVEQEVWTAKTPALKHGQALLPPQPDRGSRLT
jgi:hypothetical protein